MRIRLQELFYALRIFIFGVFFRHDLERLPCPWPDSPRCHPRLSRDDRAFLDSQEWATRLAEGYFRGVHHKENQANKARQLILRIAALFVGHINFHARAFVRLNKIQLLFCDVGADHGFRKLGVHVIDSMGVFPAGDSHLDMAFFSERIPERWGKLIIVMERLGSFFQHIVK